MLLASFRVVTVDEQNRILDPGWVRVQDGRISAVTAEPIAPEPGEEVVHGQGRLLLPGLVNTHTHLFQTLIRGVFEELPLDRYLAYVYGCGLALRSSDTYVAAVLGSLEALRSGVTTVVDHHFLNRGADLAAAAVDGMRAAGVRTILARTIMDIGDGVPPEILEEPAVGLGFVDELLNRFRQPIREGLVAIWTGPNTPGVNASDRAAIATQEYAQDRGIRRSSHVAEYRGVLDAVARRYGVDGAVRWLNGIGALGPDLLAVHAVQVSPDEVQMLADMGATVSHNPFSNLFCGDRNAPVSDYLAAGMRVGLGTDGAANNNAQGILDALKFTRLLQRLHPREPTAISPNQALRMATIDGARAVGLGDLIGSVEPGKRADLVVIDLLESPHTVPMHDVLLQLVHSVKGTDVRSAMVEGRWVMKDRQVLTVDESEALRGAQKAGRDLVARLG